MNDYKNAMNHLQEPIRLKSPTMVRGKIEDEKQPSQTQYGQGPLPSWASVGIMSFVCLLVGFVIGVVI